MASQTDTAPKTETKPQAAPQGGQTATPSPPADAFIVVPIRRMVLFPEIVLPITLQGPGAIAGAQQAVPIPRPPTFGRSASSPTSCAMSQGRAGKAI